MPALMDAPKAEKELTRQINDAAGRIRVADVLSGALGLLALTLAYALAAILLDKWLVLPDWFRQIGFAGFLLGFGALAYLKIVKPAITKINPLYAAKQVEATNPDAKNAIVNWVDLADENLPAAVKAAVADRAVREVREAEVARVGESKSLVKLGAMAVCCLVALLILVVVFSPSQFRSLAARAFTPFASNNIATKTKIALLEPAGGDVTITAGQTVTIHVEVTGRVPEANRPERLRVKVRYSPTATEYEELSLEPGTTNRDWEVRLPASVIQNGCRYTVAGGDAETPESVITVRPLPLITGFEAKYEYPAYLRLPTETINESKIEAFRGTKVSLTVKTNRELRDGKLTMDLKGLIVPGMVVPEERTSVRFDFTLDETTSYRVGFTSVSGEQNPDPYPYPIKVIGDKAPTVKIIKPADNISLPANSRLEVDALVQDDIGIAGVTLKMRVAGMPARTLKAKLYQEGKTLKRELDGSYPFRLETKESVDFNTLNNETGAKVTLKAGDVIEYWVEAIDNCTVPQPNVGQSAIQKLTLLPPELKQEKQTEDAKAAAKRKQDEQDHAKKQQDKLNNEKRDTPQPRGNPEPKPNEPNETKDPMEPKQGDPMPMGQPDPMKGGDTNPMGKPDPKENEPKQGEQGTGGTGAGGQTDPKDKKEITQKAEDIAKEIDKQDKQPGEGKASDRTDAGSGDQPPQAQPKAGGPPDAGSKPDQKPGEKQEPNANKPEDDKAGPSGGAGGEEKPATTPDANNGGEGTKPQPNEAGEAKSGQATPPAEKKQGPKDAGTEPKAEPKEGPPEGSNQELGKGQGNQGEKPSGEQKPDPNAEGQGQGQSGPGSPSKPNPEQVEKATRDLASGELERLQGAKSTLDDAVGPDKRKEMEGDAERLQKDLKSDNPAKQQEAKKKLDKMVDQAKKDADELKKKNKKEPPQGGGQGEGNGLEKAGQDISKGNEQAKKDGKQKLDDAMQKNAKDKADQLAKDLKSDDPAKKAAAEKELKDLADKAGEAGGEAGNQNPPSPEKMNELKNAAKDLASDDPDKKKAAQDKLDKEIGEGARKKAEQLAEDLKGDDAAKKAAAEKELKDLADKAGEMGNQNPPTPEKMNELKNAAKDLASDDPAKKKAAQDKLDKEIGEGARKKAEQLAQDLKGDDAGKKAAAEKELKDLADKAAKAGNGDKGMSPGDKKKLENAGKDMTGGDEKAKKDAQDAIQKAMEKDAKAKADQLAKDLQSDDPAKKAAAEKDLKDIADQMAKKNGDKGMSPEEAKEWANKAKDLNNKDDKAREKAEKEFDDKFGKDNRKNLQDKMKDVKPEDPKAEDTAKDFMNNKFDPNWQSGGGGNVMREGKPLEDDPRSKLRTKELQLQQFEKNKYNADLLKRLGVGQEDYEKFVNDFKKLVDEEKKDVAAMEKAGTLPKTSPSVNVNTGSGGNKLATRPDGTTGPAASGNAVTPPGYSDAQKRFAEEVRKQSGGNK